MRLANLTLLTLFAALLLTAPRAQSPRRPTAAEVEAMRAELRERQARREEAQRNQALVPWRRLPGSPDPAAGDGVALVRLANTMAFYRAAWTLSPGPGNPAAPVRALLCWRGEQWLALAPGPWQATAAIGRPDSVRAFRINAAPAELRRGEIYELALTPDAESAVMVMEHEAKEAASKTVEKMKAPPLEGRSAEGGARR